MVNNTDGLGHYNNNTSLTLSKIVNETSGIIPGFQVEEINNIGATQLNTKTATTDEYPQHYLDHPIQ